MPKDHFVPQFYLRHFSADKKQKQTVSATVSPYSFVGLTDIADECQELDFYEKNEALETLLWKSENDLAPVLQRVIQNQDFDVKESNALKLLAVILHLRTRKAVGAVKVFPKFDARSSIEGAIKRGELPPLPQGDSIDDVIDCKGVAGMLMQQIIPCWMETKTLAAKLLQAGTGAYFITSDNPVVVLNQFCVGADPYQSFAGYSRSGFQSVMPISPDLCLFVYDASVYKAGARQQRLVQIPMDDLEIMNSLQVQSAEESLYFHEPKMEQEVQNLIARYARLRVPLRDLLQKIPGEIPGGCDVVIQNASVKLPKQWGFCRRLRHIRSQPGDRRDPEWTALADQLMKDFEQNPNGGDAFRRLERIFA